MSTELSINPSTEQHPAPLCGRAVADALTVQCVLLNPVCQEELYLSLINARLIGSSSPG